MHSYLRSIGFSDIKNRRQLTPITKEIIAYPTTRNIITVDADTRLVQLTKDFGEGFGISLVGEMDSTTPFHLNITFLMFAVLP